MRVANLSARQLSIKRFLVGASIFLGAFPGLVTVCAQNTASTSSAPTTAPKAISAPGAPTNVDSDYSLGSTSVTFNYGLKRRSASDAIGIIPGKPPGSININWASSSGAPPSEAVVVRFDFTFNGIPCSFKYDNTPVLRQDDHYALDLGKFSSDLITQIDQLLPLSFNPADPPLLIGPVTVTIAPVLPRDQPPSVGTGLPTPTPPMPTPQAHSKATPSSIAAPAPSNGASAESTPQAPPQPIPQTPQPTPQTPQPTPQSLTSTTASSQASTGRAKLKIGTFVRTTNDLSISLQTSLGDKN
jgi:hypothetical protein